MRQTERARASGDLQPIASELHELEEAGARFAVRVTAGLDRVQAASTLRGTASRDPFLPPYRDELFVADVSETHVALLNKWCIFDHHLLVVTRAFEQQQSALAAADFEALWACMVEFQSLGFYNGGRQAGASQPHKHLQLVPLPLGTDRRPSSRAALSIEPLLDAGRLPFAYAQASLPDLSGEPPTDAAGELVGLYRRLLAEVGLDADAGPRGPYNLLLTRDRMFIVPRTRDAWDGVSINALGFAGAFLVRDREALERLSSFGLLRALARVAQPLRSTDRSG